MDALAIIGQEFSTTGTFVFSQVFEKLWFVSNKFTRENNPKLLGFFPKLTRKHLSGTSESEAQHPSLIVD